MSPAGAPADADRHDEGRHDQDRRHEKAAPTKAATAGAAPAKTAPAKAAATRPGAPDRKAGSTAWLRVTQVRSSIGTKPKHRGTLGALGLRGIGRTNLLPDRPEIRGMLARVPHLVEVAPVDHDQKGRP